MPAMSQSSDCCSTCLSVSSPMGADDRHGSARAGPLAGHLTFAIQVGAKQVFRPRLAPGEAERAGSEGRSGRDRGFVRPSFASPAVASRRIWRGPSARTRAEGWRPARASVAWWVRRANLDTGNGGEPCVGGAPAAGHGPRWRRTPQPATYTPDLAPGHGKRQPAAPQGRAKARCCSAGRGRVDMTGGRFSATGGSRADRHSGFTWRARCDSEVFVFELKP